MVASLSTSSSASASVRCRGGPAAVRGARHASRPSVAVRRRIIATAGRTRAGRVVCAVSDTDAKEAAVQKGAPLGIDRDDPMTAVLLASKVEAVVVEEQGRPLAEYMALPASQYSVLDAKAVERLDEDTFKCYIGGIGLLGFTVEPVITVSVDVGERGCVVRLLSCQLEGNRVVESINSQFEASMTNELQWRLAEGDSDEKEIVSDMTMEIVLRVPGWSARLFSPATVSSAGSKVMQQVVNQVVPRFLGQLKTDYAKWAAGDDSRKPLGEGTIAVDQK